MGGKANFSSSWSPGRGGKRQVTEEVGEKEETSSGMVVEVLMCRCWHTTKLAYCLPRSPCPFLQSCCPAGQSCCKGFFLPRCKTSHLSFRSFLRFLLDPSSSLSRCLWVTVWHLRVFMDFPPVWYKQCPFKAVPQKSLVLYL